MRPENVHISTPTKKKESAKVIWNGTWPPGTVFVIFERVQKKGMSQGWREFKQVENTSVEGNSKLVFIIFLLLNTLKGTSKALSLNLLRWNTLKGTKAFF